MAEPIGPLAIWRNILKLSLTWLVVTIILASIIIIARLLKKKRAKTFKLSARAKLEIYLAYTHIGEWIEFIQVAFSILSVILFIYGTYIDTTKPVPFIYYFLELALIFFFLLHWCLDLFVSKDKLRYLFSFFSIIDMITILPIFIDLQSGHLVSILTTFQFLRVLRVVRILRLSRVLHYFKNEVTKYTFRAFIVVFSFIMVLAGFYMNIEKLPNGDPMKFHETIYFLVITLATVGYGDIYPSTALGQITITLALTIGAGVLIPYHISKLMEKLQQDSPYLRNLSSSSITGHVILCGDISISHLLDFLSEFYHERYGKLKKELVILSPNPPDDQIKSLLLHPFYKSRLIYLQGSPLFEQDLERTKLHKAEACFIALPQNWEKADTDSILCSYAVKSMNKNIKIFSHLISSKNKNKSPFLKGSIYVEEFRSAILAQSIVCPGYNVLFSNLFTSRNIPNIVSQKWLSEYYYGCNHSVYIINTPEFLVGETLSDVILSMYFGNGSLLIGIFIPPIKPVPSNVSLNSSNPFIPIPNSTKYQNCSADKGKFFLNPPKNTVLKSDMRLVLISHTVYKSKDIAHSLLVPKKDSDGLEGVKKMFNNLFSKLAVPDLELLINEVDVGTGKEKSQDQVMNDQLKTFIGQRSKSGLNLSNRQVSLVRIESQEQFEQDLLFDTRENEEEEEPTSKELIKSLCLSEYNGDWIALLSDISSQKTNNPKTEEILERIRLIIDKNSLMTFTTYGFDKGKKKGRSNQMKGHMLIVCKSVKGLDLFLHHLRLPYISSIKTNTMAKSGVQPVVVLYHDEPEESWFSIVKTLPLIAFIKGSTSNQVDLEKCGAKTAEHIIIASDPYTSFAEESLIDSFTLMCFIDLKKVNKSAKMVVELVHEPNIRFLEDKSKPNTYSKNFHTYLQANQEKTFMKPEFFSAPHYASGSVSTYTVLDSLTCQSHFHESIKEVAHELIFGVNGVSQSYQNFGLSSLCNMESKCFSRLVGIPSIFHGRTYSELLKYFLQQKDLLCLGLYRCKEPMDAPAPYVFTCPHPTTILFEHDQVYVLSNTPI